MLAEADMLDSSLESASLETRRGASTNGTRRSIDYSTLGNPVASSSVQATWNTEQELEGT